MHVGQGCSAAQFLFSITLFYTAAHQAMATEVSLVDIPEWKALQDHHEVAKEWHMRDMFAENPKRFQEFR